MYRSEFQEFSVKQISDDAGSGEANKVQVHYTPPDFLWNGSFQGVRNLILANRGAFPMRLVAIRSIIVANSYDALYGGEKWRQ